MSFSKQYIQETIDILNDIDTIAIDELAKALNELRVNKGRVVCLGMGGSQASCVHFVNDLMKLCKIEAYAPENLSLLTAEINDNGWDSCYLNYLKAINLKQNDAIFILSVGGGAKKNDRVISAPLVACVDYANNINAGVFGIIGKEEGYVNAHADVCLVVPNKYPERLTPHLEGITGILTHLIISSPILSVNTTTW